MEDSQGRIVFIAGAGNNVNSVALFRADPATGALEKLQELPYIVMPGDTLPDRVGATGFYGSVQSLHLEKTFSIAFNDTVNDGVPEVGMGESYVFSTGAAVAGVMHPVAIRWRNDHQRAEKGPDVSALDIASGAAMTADGITSYYGSGGIVYQLGPQLDLSAHFNVGGVATVDAELQVTTQNERIYDNPILDDRNIPNVTVTCGSTTDADVPMVGGGFAPFQAGTIGVLNGSLYATSSCGCTGTPFEFALAPRGTFLNPYICQYYKAVTFTGGTPWVLGDTMAVTPNRGESSDGGSVLANADGNLLLVSPGGGAFHLARFAEFRGRPLRWHAPSTLSRNGPALAAALPDTSLTALVLRVDSLVRVMVTDPRGRRIGVTFADSVVNDYGSSAVVSALGAGGWPKLITIVGPTAGNHQVDIVGGGAGPYGVTAYLAQTALGGAKSQISGAIALGETQHRVLQLLPPLSISWLPANMNAGGPGARVAFGFDWVGPLPASGSVRFACRLPQAGRARLEIFDLSGRRLATLADGMREAGAFTAMWAGLAGDGRRLASGVYLARLTAPGLIAARRVVLTR